MYDISKQKTRMTLLKIMYRIRLLKYQDINNLDTTSIDFNKPNMSIFKFFTMLFKMVGIEKSH